MPCGLLLSSESKVYDTIVNKEYSILSDISNSSPMLPQNRTQDAKALSPTFPTPYLLFNLVRKISEIRNILINTGWTDDYTWLLSTLYQYDSQRNAYKEKCTVKTSIKKYATSLWKGWGVSLAISLLVATSFKSAIADWNDIPTGSMKPTILIGDRVLVNKLAYDFKIPYTTLHLAKWDNPKRGDIVVFFSPEDGTRLIKRVIGLPGDRIAMQQNRLFINGHFLQYSPVESGVIDHNSGSASFTENLLGKAHAVQFLPQKPSLNTFAPITVPEGQYFMMGDNRDNSADSRFFGFVDRKLIVGRARTVALSRDTSFLNLRWNRFFKELI